MTARTRFPAWAAAGMAVLALTAASAPAAEPFPVVPGADFTLTDHRGEARSSSEFRGKLMVVYFGYTECPHSCGMVLNTISAALDEMGPEAAQIVPLFITVDPEWDDTRRLAAYLRNFHPAILGLTGSAPQIAAIRGAWRVSADKVAESGAFARLIEHTTFIYLVGPDGAPRSLLPAMLPPDRIAVILRNHM